jgi:GntR family transcriptional repressor for pyruvate dehydrogenase complex
MPSSPVDAAVVALRELIVRGEYRPGDRLPPERELAERLGVQRSVVREAIRRLADRGALVAQQGSGTYLACIDVQALFAVRMQLEPFAAQVAAVTRDEDDLTQMTALMKRLRAQVAVQGTFGVVEFDLHVTIARTAGNAILSHLVVEIIELARLATANVRSSRRVRRDAVRQLQQVLDAISAGEGDAAREVMAAHLAGTLALARAATPPPRPALPSALA